MCAHDVRLPAEVHTIRGTQVHTTQCASVTREAGSRYVRAAAAFGQRHTLPLAPLPLAPLLVRLELRWHRGHSRPSYRASKWYF